jgi:hypothetical protein
MSSAINRFAPGAPKGFRPMIRISLPYFVSISESLEPLATLKPKDIVNDVVFMMFGAHATLSGLLSGSVFSANLRSSRQTATGLSNTLEAETDANKDWARELGYPAILITQAYAQFKTAFSAEIGTFPAYFVNQKGSFDTLTLLDEPWRMYPIDLWNKIPEARFDMIEAGKALCYELPTACGMHTFRLVESVLRRYYTEVTNGKALPKRLPAGIAFVDANAGAGAFERAILAHDTTMGANPPVRPNVGFYEGVSRLLIIKMLLVQYRHDRNSLTHLI